MNLFRQHFYQCIEVLRFGKSIKINHPRKEIKLSKKSSDFKTIYLDMDETLIHCDERSNNYTVKLNFPLEKGGILAVNIFLILGRNKGAPLLPIIPEIAILIRINNNLYCK